MDPAALVSLGASLLGPALVSSCTALLGSTCTALLVSLSASLCALFRRAPIATAFASATAIADVAPPAFSDASPGGSIDAPSSPPSRALLCARVQRRTAARRASQSRGIHQPNPMHDFKLRA